MSRGWSIVVSRALPVTLVACWLTADEEAAVRDRTRAPEDDPRELMSDLETDPTDAPVATDDPPTDCVDGDLGPAVGDQVVNTDNVGAVDDKTLPCATPGGRERTWRWHAVSDGCWLFDSTGSTYNVALAVLTDCDGSALVCESEPAGPTTGTRVSLPLEADQEVIVVADGADADAIGTTRLAILPLEAPEIAVDIGSATGTAVARGRNADADSTWAPASCPGGSGADVFVRWVAPSADTWRFTAAGTDFDAVLSVHHPCDLDGLACDDGSAPGADAVSVSLAEGEEVLVRIAGFKKDDEEPETGSWVLNIR